MIRNMKRSLALLLAVLITKTLYSQSISDQDIAQGEKFLSAYFNPMAASFGSSLNNGWYNTAKPHSLGGFDLTITLNTVIIPSAGKTFNIQEAGGTTFTSVSTDAATVFGTNQSTSMTYNGIGFDMPGGALEASFIPIPMIQAGIGLIKKTGLDFRFLPSYTIKDAATVSLFGVGIKHDLLQWIPGVGDAIPISFSFQAGYTSLKSIVTVPNTNNQEISLNTQATTMNLIASKKILMFTGHIGLGYNFSNTSLSTDTDFNLSGIKFDDPIGIVIKNNNIRANIGLRYNITLVTIQADYTFSEYPTATLGLGVSFR